MNVIRSFVFISFASIVIVILLLASELTIAAESSSSAGSKSSSSSSSDKASSRHNPHYTTATQSRASTAASVIGALGSLVPGLITNVAPLVLLVGLGALMMPSLGMSAMGLLRESRRSSNDQASIAAGQVGALPVNFASYARPLQTSPQDIYYFTKRSFPTLMSNLNTAGIMNGLNEVLERVARAIDNADKRYN